MNSRTCVRMLVVLVLLTAFVATPIVANAAYVVKPGDVLSGIAARDPDPVKTWQYLRNHPDNQFLRGPRRLFTLPNGKIDARIYPGEILAGVDESGQPYPYSVYGGNQLPEPRVDGNPEGPPKVVEVWPPWLLPVLIILGLLLLIAAAGCLIIRLQTTKPENQTVEGPPMVDGGITPENAVTTGQRAAARAYEQMTGQRLNPSAFHILSSTGGRAWGTVNVGFRDGSSRIENFGNEGDEGTRAYEHVARFPNGRVQPLYSKQLCGNDMRFSGVDDFTPGPDFRFMPEVPAVAEVAAPPAPALVEVPPAPVPASAPAATDNQPPAGPVVEENVFKFEMRQATSDQQAMIRLTGVDQAGDNTVTVKEGEVTIRFTPRS